MVKVSYDDEHNTVIIEFEGNIDAAQAESFFPMSKRSSRNREKVSSS
jgi:hypothetical protein